MAFPMKSYGIPYEIIGYSLCIPYECIRDFLCIPYEFYMNSLCIPYECIWDSRSATMPLLGVLPRRHHLKQSLFLWVGGSRKLPRIYRAGAKKKIAPKLLREHRADPNFKPLVQVHKFAGPFTSAPGRAFGLF